MTKESWPDEKFMWNNYNLLGDKLTTQMVINLGKDSPFEAEALYNSAESKVAELNNILSDNEIRKDLRWNLLTNRYMWDYGEYRLAKGFFLGGLSVTASFMGGYGTMKLIKRLIDKRKKH